MLVTRKRLRTAVYRAKQWQISINSPVQHKFLNGLRSKEIVFYKNVFFRTRRNIEKQRFENSVLIGSSFKNIDRGTFSQ